jgi:protein-S-isoprenylcysteine O-methyltransferase Ste14
MSGEKQDIGRLALLALKKFVGGVVVVGAILFLSAGTIFYPEAWCFMGLLFIPMLVMGVVMLVASPDVLNNRLRADEQRKTQKMVSLFSGLIFLSGFIISGLDFRFSLSEVPIEVRVVASVVFILSYLLYAEVVRENRWLFRTVEVDEQQSVVNKGLYGVVRHPMYLATILMFLSMPLVLGSWWSFLCFLPYVFIVEIRIRNEEKILDKELLGYAEYKKRVKYKILPYVW